MNTMSDQYISIKDASDLSGKSIQTIRRAIKAKKFKFKKQRTPQGFNYLIDKESFFNEYNISRADTTRNLDETRAVVAPTQTSVSTELTNFSNQLQEFSRTLEKIVDQHAKEKENLFKLIETFQNKVISLENKLKLVEESVKRKWWKVW